MQEDSTNSENNTTAAADNAAAGTVAGAAAGAADSVAPAAASDAAASTASGTASGRRVAYVFTDERGAVLAENLLRKGHKVTGYVPTHVSACPQTTVPLAADLASALRGAEFVFTLLDGPSQTEEVYFDRNGILECVTEKCFLIDHTIAVPRFARELHAMAAVHDCYYADAPLTEDLTGSAGINHGAAHALLGGYPDTVALAEPLIRDAGLVPLRTGMPGTGAAAKVAMLSAQAASLLGIAETLAFARSCNIDGQVMLELIASNPLRSESEKTLARMVVDERFDCGFPLQRFYQEIAVALDAADELNLAMPVIETAHQLFDLLMMIGASGMGVHALALIFSEEEHCKKHGLNWELAQRFMDVYEHIHDDDCDFEDYDDFDDFDDGNNHHFSAN